MLDCSDREALHWAVTIGGFNSETVQDVMLGALERRFGNDLPSSPVEWLTDNGSCYRANETRQFARMLGLEPKNTAVRSPESNGIADNDTWAVGWHFNQRYEKKVTQPSRLQHCLIIYLTKREQGVCTPGWKIIIFPPGSYVSVSI